MSAKKNSVIVNFIWRFMERCGAQLVTFVVSVVLARLLDPEVYGTVALVTVFTTILQTFVDSGLGNALIQKKDADDLDFSSVFYVNIVFCTILYIGICLASPFIASFYKSPELVPIICVIGLMIVISGVRNIQQAYVSRKMMFKKFFFSTLGGTIAAAVVGITMAALGFGVWALVVQMLVNFAVGTLVLWVTVKWRPKLMFSFERVKSLFSFGWKLLASNLLETLYREIYQLIIGKMYSVEDLAFYNKGKQFPNLVITNVNISIESVLLPAMSNVQNDTEQVRAMTRRAMKTSALIIFPLMVGLGVCADFLIPLLLSEKWNFCIPYLRIFCFTYAFYPIQTANLNAIKAMGRSDLFLVLEIVKKIIGVVMLVATMWFGVMTMAYSLLVSTALSSVVNAFPNRKLLNYSYIEQIKDLLPTMAISAIMGAVVYCVSFLNLGAVASLLIQVPLGVIIYVSLSKLFKLESFEYILSVVKDLFSNKISKNR